MGQVIPFPLARREAFIRRHAQLIATMRPDVGRRHLERQLAFQAKTLLAKNIDISAVDREVTRLRAAIRTAVVLAFRDDRGDIA
jgi:hypothetical protein